MAQQQQTDPRAYDRPLIPLLTKPGIKRDGTDLEDDYFSDGTWVRFYRGRPRKMNGYRSIKDSFIGPIRALYRRGRLLTSWHNGGVDWGELDDSGSLANFAAGVMPGSFSTQNDYTWQVDSLYNSATTQIVVVAHPGRNLNDIDNAVATNVIYATANNGGINLATFADAGKTVSGGVVVLQPFVFAYGSKGEISNSDTNKPATWAGGNANTAFVSGTKFVKGLPIRGGANSPSGLFWSLDNLVRVSYVGGTTLFKYDTLSANASILSPNSVIEFDGTFFWAGLDRFLMYNGTVREVPNQLNLDYFFEEMNWAYSQKVFAYKVPRHGEIWWFYPSGTNTECNRAVIFNVREGTWYDATIGRSAGNQSQTSRFPIMSESTAAQTDQVITLSASAGTWAEGDTVTAGGISGTVHRSSLSAGVGNVYISNATGTFPNAGAVVTSAGGTGTISAQTTAQMHRLWMHEFGYDKVTGDVVTEIESSFTTQEFGMTTSGEGTTGVDRWTALTRVEPDFAGVGNMSIEMLTRHFSQSETVVVERKDSEIAVTEYVDFSKEGRYIKLRFTSSGPGNYYQSGTCKTSVKPGSRRE